MPKPNSFVQAIDGEPIVVDLDIKGRIGEHNIACCDCGLVHKLKFTVCGDHLVIQAYHDKKATKRRRREKKHRKH